MARVVSVGVVVRVVPKIPCFVEIYDMVSRSVIYFIGFVISIPVNLLFKSVLKISAFKEMKREYGCSTVGCNGLSVVGERGNSVRVVRRTVIEEFTVMTPPKKYLSGGEGNRLKVYYIMLMVSTEHQTL